MDAVAITIGLSWTICGLLCLGLSIPLIRGQVPRNHLYGVRMRTSLASDDAWFAINRFWGKRQAFASVFLIATGITSFFIPLERRTGLTLTLGFLPLIFILAPLVQTLRFARQFSTKT